MEIIFSGGKTWIITVYLCSLTNQEWQYVMADTCATYIKDELWPLEWYLNKSETDKYDMNVLPAWKSCVNGTGVTVGVVDKGIQDHFDLNINRAISFGDAKTGTINSFKHGTRVAGIIGALKNGNQTVGIAFGSEIADIKVASSSMFKTLDVEALTHHMNIIDVYSSSFANFHTGTVTYPLLTEQEESFKRGTKFGRGGLGSVYVFATGNSGGDDTDFGRDSCAYDRLVTNRYVISVAGIQNDLTKLPTGEFCSAMMVAAFTAKAGATHHKLVTTDIGNKSTEYFNQNSAATPMVSGAVVLALSANPRLSYRDVMHLLVLTCRGDLPEFEQGGNYFMKNAANLSVSSYFGFGLLDIGALVEKCKVWENVPQVMNCSASNNRRRPVRSNSHTVLVNMCNIHYVEHVEVSLKVQHRHAGQIQWVLISPYGTRSTVLPGRGLDSTREINLTVLTVQMWGENPNGQWRLEPTAVFGSNLDNGTVELFSITIYGCTCIPGLKCLPPAKQEPTTDSVRWNLTSAAERHDVSCLSDSISVFIPSDLLSHYQTTWRDPHCQVHDNGTHYVSTISHTSCGTTVIFTKDEVIFENELILHKSGSPSNQTSNGSIDFGSSDSEVIPVQCIYPRRQNISTLYRPAQSTVRFYEKRYGHMDVQLEQYKSGMFVTPLPVRSFPNEVEINKDMYFILHAMHVNSTDVAVKVDSCVATPSNMPADGRIYQLLDQGCPASPAVKVYPSAFDEVRFSVRAFEFRTSPGGIVYIHCQVSVCSPTSPQCRVGCAHRHRREVSTEDGGSHLVSGGPYLLVADKGGLQVSTVVAGVCASVAVVATVIAIIGWRRKSSASTSSSKL